MHLGFRPGRPKSDTRGLEVLCRFESQARDLAPARLVAALNVGKVNRTPCQGRPAISFSYLRLLRGCLASETP
jgi:hypothetical protein